MGIHDSACMSWTTSAISVGASQDDAQARSSAQLPASGPQPLQPWAEREPAALAVDIHAAARMLGVCHVTVRREIERGELRAVRIGRVWRVRVAELHAYLKRKEN